MTIISMPKDKVENYRRAIAMKVTELEDPQVRRALELAMEDPGRAFLQLLQPYLQGNLVMLHTSYGYGSIDLVDGNDGFYRMDIPDKYIKSNMPRKYRGRSSFWARLFGR